MPTTFLQGDDEIYVLSTEPSMFLSLYGGLGSDNFIITPSTVSSMVSKNPRGHRGIIQHTVVSADDESYDGLIVRSVEANILDNDGDFAWVYIVDQEGPHLITEDEVGTFSFAVYPTTMPEDDLYFIIAAPAERDDDGNPYVLVNEEETEILHWASGNMNPIEIEVSYNPDANTLDCTEKYLVLELHVDLDVGRTKDHRFVNGGKTLSLQNYVSVPLFLT